MDIEKLILCVSKYPMLYDVGHSEYKLVKQKDKIWDAIGEELQENGEELKKKWKNLRDCYSRYLRSWDLEAIQSKPYTTRYYKSWPWAKQMEIFKPYLKCGHVHKKTELNDSMDPIEAAEKIEGNEQNEPNQDLPRPSRAIRKRKRETESSVDKIIKFLKEKEAKSEINYNNLNATEHMFLGFAKTIATFSARRQASVKMRIANMVLEEELFEREEREGSELQSVFTVNEAGEDQKVFIGNYPEADS